MASAAEARRRRRVRWAGVLGVLFATASVVSWIGFAASDASLDAYLSARACPPGATAEVAADCLVVGSAEVHGTYA